MTGPRPAELLRHLAAEAAPDADLLRRFATTRDGAAFAELVRRHGPVVLAACRRGVRHHHDAEDAFQAVFLVLARRAGAIERPELLGNWLYRVAVRVTGHARRAVARRRVREVQGVDIPEPTAPASAPSDLGSVVDAELDALPAQYRDAVILCDLRGVPRADAAAALGIPLGTLASRLDAARKKLAARLVRRGVTLSVGAMLVEAKAVAVPEGLVSKACEVVAAWSSGGVLPQSLLKLVQGGLGMRQTMFLGLVAAVVTTVVGVGLAARPEPPRPAGPPTPSADADTGQPEEKRQPARADPAPARLGTPELARKEDLPLKDARGLAWSPDGKLLAVSGTRPGRPVPADAFPAEEATSLYVLSVADRKLQAGTATLPDGGLAVGFSADGASVMTVVTEPGLISGSTALQLWTADAVTPGGVKVQFIRVQKGPAFDLPDRATGFVAAGPSVRFVVPEYGKSGISRAEIRGLDAKTGAIVGPFGAVAGTLQATALAPDAARVAVMTTAGAVEVNGLDGKQAWAAGLHTTALRPGLDLGLRYAYLTYSKDGAVLLAGQPAFRPTAFDARTGKLLPAFEGSESAVQGGWAAAVSADGRLAAVADVPLEDPARSGGGPPGPRLTVWDTRTGKQVRTWQGNATALAFHPTRPVLAVLEATRGGTRLGLWDFSAQP